MENIYVNTQKISKTKDNNGYNIHLDYFYSLKSASEATLKGTYNSVIYLSNYGECDYSWEYFIRFTFY